MRLKTHFLTGGGTTTTTTNNKQQQQITTTAKPSTRTKIWGTASEMTSNTICKSPELDGLK
jgi:hypothetical protein